MHPYLRFDVILGGGAGREVFAGPPFPSPMLRRVLGRALIDRFCPFGQPRCEDKPAPPLRQPPPGELCRLAQECPYGVLFAASRTARPPYALYVPPVVDDAPARIELTLYGAAWRLYPWALASLAQALRQGLGKARTRWAVEEVRRVRPDGQAERLAGRDLSSVASDLRPDLLGLALQPCLTHQPVAVELLSPARLLREGRLLPGREPVPFELLIARILDRFTALYGDAGSDILRPEIRAVVEAEAARVRLLTDQTRWIEVRDYSARSGSELLLGGKVGRLVYGGEASRFLPVLRAGEILHLGKNTASGCGRIQVGLPAAA
jgi:hypothetical protein